MAGQAGRLPLPAGSVEDAYKGKTDAWGHAPLPASSDENAYNYENDMRGILCVEKQQKTSGLFVTFMQLVSLY